VITVIHFSYLFTGVGTGPADPAAAGQSFDKQEFLSSHYIHFREREMNKNTSGKMHTLWSIDSQEN